MAAQELGASINAQVLEFQGSISAKINAESSQRRQYHNLNLNFEAQNLFKILSKIASVKAKLLADGSKVDFRYEIVRLGELRSFVLKSANNKLRSEAGGKKSFDVAYEKTLSTGKVYKANGVASFSIRNLKNLDVNINVKDSFFLKLSAENTRQTADLSLGPVHKLNANYAHLDYQPTERLVQLSMSNSSNGNEWSLDFLAKNGKPGALADLGQLYYLFDLKQRASNAIVDGERVALKRLVNYVAKIKPFNVDGKFTVDYSFDPATKSVKIDYDRYIQVPAVQSQPPGQLVVIKESLAYAGNRATKALAFTHKFETDSKLIGKFAKSIESKFTREVKSEVGESTLDVTYTQLASGDEKKRLYVRSQSDCLTGKCTMNKLWVKQQALAQLPSRFLPGQLIDISECAYERRSVRVKEEGKYLLDVAVSAECAGKKLLAASGLIKRDESDDDLPATSLGYSLESDLYFPKRRLLVEHKKFGPANGLISLDVERAGELQVASKFAYTRQVDAQTGRLVSGEYKLDTRTGGADSNSKSCVMKIESNANYLNTLRCQLNAAAAKGVELVYGYAVRVNSLSAYAAGKRDIALDLFVPGRTLRLDYQVRITKQEQEQRPQKQHKSN